MHVMSAYEARHLVLGVATGAAAVCGSLYLLGAWAGMAAAGATSSPAGAAHRRRTGGAAAAAPRSTTSSGIVKGGGSAVYESAKAVDEYLLFHFAEASLLMPYEFGPREATAFPQRCAQLVAKHAKKGSGKALDIGCAVGGATFELARTFNSVVGVDFSQAFVDTAKKLQDGERLPCTAMDEGILNSWFVASAPADVDGRRIKFQQGDACNLPTGDFGPFDAVLASNLLCRLPKPQQFLESLPRIVAPGGVVALISPYSWLEEYTPMSEWMGGTIRDGNDIASAPAVKAKMASLGFTLVDESDMPFLIREHARKFQYGCSHATVWRRSA